MVNSVFAWVENIVGKPENAGFHMVFSLRVNKNQDCLQLGLNPLPDDIF